MKKAIALVFICLLAMMCLTSCGADNSADIAELRQQIESLETRVAELEQNPNAGTSIPVEEANSPTADASTVNTSAEPSNATVVGPEISQYLDNQVRSDDPNAWLEVASCEQASEEHLIAVAKKCANIDYYYYTSDDRDMAVEIANAFSANSSATDNVMATLAGSEFPEVWLVIAKSSNSYDLALTAVAKQCANIDYYYYTSDDKDMAIEIANALSANSHTTDAVMEVLAQSEFPDVWLVIAKSSKAYDLALTAVAKQCAKIDYYYYSSDNEDIAIKIADALCNNTNSTKEAIQELSNSEYPEVISSGHQWLENVA